MSTGARCPIRTRQTARSRSPGWHAESLRRSIHDVHYRYRASVARFGCVWRRRRANDDLSADARLAYPQPTTAADSPRPSSPSLEPCHSTTSNGVCLYNHPLVQPLKVGLYLLDTCPYLDHRADRRSGCSPSPPLPRSPSVFHPSAVLKMTLLPLTR